MKHLLGCVLAALLVCTLAGCGQEAKPDPVVYTFYGENELLRVTNGVAVLGGEQDTFYGGKLEVKQPVFEDMSSYIMTFYFENGDERHTMLSMASHDVNGSFELLDQEIGWISGAIRINQPGADPWPGTLYFELEALRNGTESEVYTIPMEAVQVTGEGAPKPMQ